MNGVYIFCDECRTYLGAGYRHAVVALQQCGLIAGDLLGSESPFVRMDGERVLACSNYWHPDPPSAELLVRLEHVRAFLADHRSHSLSFGDIHRILQDGGSWSDWLSEDGDEELSPRYLVERLRLVDWAQVEAYVAGQDLPPWWWGDATSETRAQGRAEFEALIRKTRD